MSTKLKTKTTMKNRIAANGQTKKAAGKKDDVQVIEIAAPEKRLVEMVLVGDRPLLVNNKYNVAEELDAMYHGPGGKSGAIKPPDKTKDEQYLMAFYVMPSSKHKPPNPKGKYGIPTSGIKKCFMAGVRCSGIRDNTTIGTLQKGVTILSDGGGLCQITFDRLERDVRPVNVGKSMPQMRHRPMFHGWKCKIRVQYNPQVISIEGLINVFNFSGPWIGMCELRAQKGQGECGGFTVESV